MPSHVPALPFWTPTVSEAGSQAPLTARSGEADAAAPGVPLEHRLLERYRAGEQAAMDELIVLYQDRAFWVARHLVDNDEMALDIAQDAFVRLIRHYQQYDPRRNGFQAWFLRIVRNMAIDHLRKQRLRSAQQLVEVAAERPRDTVEQSELGARIRAVLDGLPEHYRELIVLRDIEELSPQDIAVMQDADYGTTRWRIHNARKLFRQAWQQRYGAELP